MPKGDSQNTGHFSKKEDASVAPRATNLKPLQEKPSMDPIVAPFPDEETEAQREVTCPWHPAGNRVNRELLLYHSRRVGGPAPWVQGGPGPGLNPGSAPHLLVSPGKLLGLPRLTCPLCPMGKYSRIKAHSSCSCGESWREPHVRE